MSIVKKSEESLFEVPFDDADADLILHSADEKHFRVFKVILRKTSAFFSEMFTLPPPRCRDPTTPQEMTLAEDGATVDSLLRICYPSEELDFEALTLANITSLLVAADKYSIPIVTRRCSEVLKARAAADPLRVYVIATRNNLDGSVALAAAMACLCRPQSYIVDADIPEMRMLSLTAYQRLLQFHAKCTAAAVKTVTGDHLTWITNTSYVWFKCRDCGYKKTAISLTIGQMSRFTSTSGQTGGYWWADLMREVAEEIKCKGPLGFSVRGNIRVYEKLVCANCTSAKGMNDLVEFTERMHVAIVAAVLAAAQEMQL